MRSRRGRFVRSVVGAAVLAGVFAAAAYSLAFSDASYFFPTGVVGQSYNHQLGPRGGSAPYSYHVISGGLPPGLSLGSGSGQVTGVPSAAGTWSFWVELGDSYGLRTQDRFTINVIAGLAVTTSSLQPARLNEPYSVQLSASGGGTQTWRADGALPPGLTLSATGLLAGTPTQAGTFEVTVRVSDASRSGTRTLELDVLAPLELVEPVTPPAELGRDFEMLLQASGGKRPYQWTVAAGGLPPGLTLAGDDVVIVSRTAAGGAVRQEGRARISGEPTAAGTFGATIKITDAVGQERTTQVLIRIAARLEVSTQRLRVARIGRLYRAALKTKGGVGPLKWRVASGRLPVGFRLDRATGVLSGTAKRAGTYTFAVLATDRFKIADNADLTLTVRP